MTRHDLKDQLQHDQFTDAVSGVVSYTKTNRRQVTRWLIVGVVIVAVGAVIFGFLSYRKSQRQDDLARAMAVVNAPVGPGIESAKTYPTEDAKTQASLNALSEVAAKDANSNEGMIALYYLATLKAKKDQNSAEGDLKRVADSRSDASPLAKIALAQLYMGQNKTSQAQDLLRSIINNPSQLVSKAQAQILLAQTEAIANPADSRSVLKMIDPNDSRRPSVARASEAVAAQLK